MPTLWQQKRPRHKYNEFEIDLYIAQTRYLRYITFTISHFPFSLAKRVEQFR